MSIKEIWRAHLRAIVDQEASAIGGTTRDGYRAVAEKIHKNVEFVYQIYNGHKGMGDATAAALAKAYGSGRPASWINSPIATTGLTRKGHPLSHETITIPSLPADLPLVAWGDMEIDQLPAVFAVTAPDDSMADRVTRGQILQFDRGLEPHQGDGVIVADSEDCWYFRLYSPGAQGRFQALPINRDYQALDSERDGLRVIAVLTGVQGRWG